MKILFVATVVRTHIMEFHIPYLKMLKEMGCETAVAARNDYISPDECRIPYCDNYYDIGFRRNPIHPDNLKAYHDLRKLIDAGGYDIIHCHTPVGGVLARFASKKARCSGSKVIYTVHGFHFYKGAPLINWVLYYPVERFLARFTDLIVTINKEDYERAKAFRATAVAYLPGIGIDIQKFSDKSKSADRCECLKKTLGIPEDAVMLLSVGEVNRNKNHRLVIKALPDLEKVWYVVCGSGPLIEKLKNLAADLSVSDRVIFAGYRNDVADFYNIADLFIFPSFREGLPVALMEAMASGLVCVAARNRGTNDLLENSQLRFAASSVEELKEKIRIALTEDCSAELQQNFDKLREYDLRNVLSVMKRLYTDIME